MAPQRSSRVAVTARTRDSRPPPVRGPAQDTSGRSAGRRRPRLYPHPGCGLARGWPLHQARAMKGSAGKATQKAEEKTHLARPPPLARRSLPPRSAQRGRSPARGAAHAAADPGPARARRSEKRRRNAHVQSSETGPSRCLTPETHRTPLLGPKQWPVPWPSAGLSSPPRPPRLAPRWPCRPSSPASAPASAPGRARADRDPARHSLLVFKPLESP